METMLKATTAGREAGLPVAVYADGGCIVGNPSPLGGTYAWVQVNAANSRITDGGGLILPTQYQVAAITNNMAEMVAVLEALEQWPDGVEGVLYTDSEVTLNRVWGNWALNGLPPLLSAWVKRVKRGGKVDQVTGDLVAGHPTIAELTAGFNRKGRPVSRWNVWVDTECNRFAQQFIDGTEGGRYADR